LYDAFLEDPFVSFASEPMNLETLHRFRFAEVDRSNPQGSGRPSPR